MFHIHHVPLAKDGMMSMSNETCNRATKVFSLLKDDPMTVAMYDRNREFLEPIFYKTLREKV